MRRKTFDLLVSTGGLVLAAVLLVAGGLLMWGYSFANSQVHDQLVAQKIVFPTNSNPEFKALPASRPAAHGRLRWPDADHRRAGQDVRRPLHRGPPGRDGPRQDLLPAVRPVPGPA